MPFPASKMFAVLCLASLVAAQPAAAEFSEGERDFMWSDLGAINTHSLKTHSLPKSVAFTALVLEGRRRKWIGENSTDYGKVLEKVGFFKPVRIASSGDAEYGGSLPIGLTEKDVRIAGLPFLSVRSINVSCAACHAGRTYDSNGNPTRNAWLGLPNTSLNLELYTQSLYRGTQLIRRDFENSYRLLKRMFPDLSGRERAILRYFVFPEVRKRMGGLERTIDRPTPFSNGSPGLTNGVGALKFMLNMFDAGEIQQEHGYTSVPALGDRAFRTSLLYDGLYGTPTGPPDGPKGSWGEADLRDLSRIVSVFAIPSMGQTVKGVFQSQKRVHGIVRDVVSRYDAPRFPGEIDLGLALSGAKVYSRSCASCHGDYRWDDGRRPRLVTFPNKFVPQDLMRTDPERWRVITPDFIEKFSRMKLDGLVKARRNEGYFAPLLNSLWATAPYLHNGSVPTLWDLMNPASRPAAFLVGGHGLDLEKVGIRLERQDPSDLWIYPGSVIPWSQPEAYDTKLPGRGNQGHESPFDQLTQKEKSDLLEFLKLL